MSATFMLGVKLMLYGLGGVFSTLIVFMLAIVLLTKCFPEKDKPEEQ